MEKGVECSEIGCELAGLGNSSEQEGGAHRSEGKPGALQAQRERPIGIAKEDVFRAPWADRDAFCGFKFGEGQVGWDPTSQAVANRLEHRSGGDREPAERRLGSRQSRIDERVETPR